MVVRSEILSDSERTLAFTDGLRLDTIIDVRSAREFTSGSVPDSHNLPLFDDDERALVGTIYKQGGKAEAIDTGFDIVEAKLQEFLKLFEPYRGSTIGVFCARGGMRSRSVVNLLNKHGFEAYQLIGGYKQYRHQVQEKLQSFEPELIVLHGLTGVGKTRILYQLDHMIDLEGIARHQSSLFGGLNRHPRGQKDFDAHLYKEVCSMEKIPYFIEGESRKMGDIYLPSGLAGAMQKGHLVHVYAPLEKRVERIVEDYPVNDDKTREAVRAILVKLTPHLGKKIAGKLCRLLDEGNLSELVRILLVDYYDQRYKNNLDRYRYVFEVDSTSIADAAVTLQGFRENLMRK